MEKQLRELIEPPKHLDELAHAVIGAAIEVHRALGPGFLEAVYEGALVLELKARGIRVMRQVPIPILYREAKIAEARLDLLIEDELVVEVKSVEQLSSIHTAQVLSYLRAGRFLLGLLINFNVSLLRDGVRRVVSSCRTCE